MSQILKSYNLFIDSSQRDEGSAPSYFSIVLKKPITKTSKDSYFRVRIPSLVIPFSFTQVNSSNNILSYTYNSINYSITVPPGNYDIVSLLTKIQELIQTQTATVLNFTYDGSTSKATLGFDTGNIVSGAVNINYSGNNIILLKMLGFTSNITFSYNISTNIYVNQTSNQVVNISPSKTLFIRSETLIQNTNYESLVSKNETTDILLQVPILTSFQTYINYHDQASDLWSEINNVVIDKVNLYISDSTSFNELPSDSGLLNWFCQVNIQEIYRPSLINVDNILNNNVEQVKHTETDTTITEIKQMKDQLMKELEDKKKGLEKQIKEYTNKKNLSNSNASA